MKTDELIRVLDDIDRKLNNSTRKEKPMVRGAFTGDMIELPERTVNLYSHTEQMVMWQRKFDIIRELNERGVIDEEGFKAYMLSESPAYTPKLIFEEG